MYGKSGGLDPSMDLNSSTDWNETLKFSSPATSCMCSWGTSCHSLGWSSERPVPGGSIHHIITDKAHALKSHFNKIHHSMSKPNTPENQRLTSYPICYPSWWRMAIKSEMTRIIVIYKMITVGKRIILLGGCFIC